MHENELVMALARAKGVESITTIKIGPESIDESDQAPCVRAQQQGRRLFIALRDALPARTLDELMISLVDLWAARRVRSLHRARVPASAEDFADMVALLRKTRDAVQGVPDAVVPAEGIVDLLNRIGEQGVEVDDLDDEDFEV